MSALSPSANLFFFESDVRYDQTTGAGTITTGFEGLTPLNKLSGQPRAWDPNLRPQFTQQWNLFTEYQLTSGMSAQVGYVGHHATKLVTSVAGNQPLPGVGDPATWAPLNTRRPLYAALPLVTNISTTASRGRSNYNALQASIRQREWNGLEFLASYTFARILTNNLGYYGSAGVAAEGFESSFVYRILVVSRFSPTGDPGGIPLRSATPCIATISADFPAR